MLRIALAYHSLVHWWVLYVQRLAQFGIPCDHAQQVSCIVPYLIYVRYPAADFFFILVRDNYDDLRSVDDKAADPLPYVPLIQNS